MSEDCPQCRFLASQMRQVADSLAAGAGSVVGGRLFGPRGAAVGADIAPYLVERGALAVADKVKAKRKQSPKQKARAKKMSKAMKMLTPRAKKKDGTFKRGWDQRRIMREAHRMCK